MRLSRLVSLLVLLAVIALPVGMTLAQQFTPARAPSATVAEGGTYNVSPTRALPATVAGGGCPYNVSPTRALPATVEKGATFNVTVNFTAPADVFNSIVLRDIAPDGWNVTAEAAWCTPYPPDNFNPHDNVMEVGWTGEKPNYFDKGTPFIARYQFTVPCEATPGNYTFNLSTPADVYLDYWVGEVGQCNEPILGKYNITVIGPTINFTPESIDFYGAVNGTNPQNQSLELWGSTRCGLNWSLTDDAVWLEEYPINGNCNETHSSVNLSVNTSGMNTSVADYSANITINSTEANNSPRIVPVRLHIRETSTLQGHVSFVGRGEAPDDGWIELFDVWLFNPGTTAVLWKGNATTNNTGFFNITDVVVGTYDIGIKSCRSLSELVTNVTSNSTEVVEFGTIRVGDANGDDWVTSKDKAKLYKGWGSSEGMPGWNPNADFNNDGWLTSKDKALLYKYWGRSGDLVGYF
jgi:hypothetical protein